MTLPSTTAATVDEQGDNPPRYNRTPSLNPDPLPIEEDASPFYMVDPPLPWERPAPYPYRKRST